MRKRERERESKCVCMCVCVCEREKKKVFLVLLSPPSNEKSETSFRRFSAAAVRKKMFIFSSLKQSIEKKQIGKLNRRKKTEEGNGEETF